MRALLVAIALLAFGAPAAQAAERPPDIPFIDGRGSARAIEIAINGRTDMRNVTCEYRRPVIVCRGFARMPKTDGYVAVTLMFHKTAPRRGYVTICGSVLGIGSCKTQPMRYAR